MRLAIRVCFPFLMFSGACMAHAQFAHLVLESDPGDWVGGGQNWDVWYTPADSNWLLGTGSQPINGNPSYLQFTLAKKDINNDFYSLMFFSSTQLGQPLDLGTYIDAERAPFASPGHPGLDVSFQGRGSNTLTGEFTVEEFNYHVDPQDSTHFFIDDFVVDFTQHSEGLDPALQGRFSFHAVPEPATMTALALGASTLLLRRRRKR